MTLALLAPRSNQLSYYGSPLTRVGEAACGPGLTRAGTDECERPEGLVRQGKSGRRVQVGRTEGGRGPGFLVGRCLGSSRRRRKSTPAFSIQGQKPKRCAPRGIRPLPAEERSLLSAPPRRRLGVAARFVPWGMAANRRRTVQNHEATCRRPRTGARRFAARAHSPARSRRVPRCRLLPWRKPGPPSTCWLRISPWTGWDSARTSGRQNIDGWRRMAERRTSDASWTVTYDMRT